MGRFQHSEIRTLYLAALNYCVSKINQGRQDFARRAFALYRKGLETHILLEKDTVSRYTFGNAVGAALRNQEYAWAEKFIGDFQHHLDEKERNSIVNFNLSRVYFERGDYDKAQSLLTQFEYDDMLFNIIAKTMLLKIYHEQEELDAFESLLESMRTYLQRKEALDPARKAAYKNMISLMKKLLHLNIFSKVQREKFHELVTKTNPLAEREWLLKQIE
jgi:tetratricopeptide (TPR) repeat protein